MHHSDAPLRELIKAGLDVFHGKLHGGIWTIESYIGGIALLTNVTLGKCIPSMLCVVNVYCCMLL